MHHITSLLITHTRTRCRTHAYAAVHAPTLTYTITPAPTRTPAATVGTCPYNFAAQLFHVHVHATLQPPHGPCMMSHRSHSHTGPSIGIGVHAKPPPPHSMSGEWSTKGVGDSHREAGVNYVHTNDCPQSKSRRGRGSECRPPRCRYTATAAMSPPLTQLATSITLLLHHATNATAVTPASTIRGTAVPTLSLHPLPYHCNCYEEQHPAPNDRYHDHGTAHTVSRSTTMPPLHLLCWTTHPALRCHTNWRHGDDIHDAGITMRKHRPTWTTAATTAAQMNTVTGNEHTQACTSMHTVTITPAPLHGATAHVTMQMNVRSYALAVLLLRHTHAPDLQKHLGQLDANISSNSSRNFSTFSASHPSFPAILFPLAPNMPPTTLASKFGRIQSVVNDDGELVRETHAGRLQMCLTTLHTHLATTSSFESHGLSCPL
ncbi:hypothetical protein K439DRAFT_1539666 [Ramaria rubella]|nr:hypothetical protein K439DRAFT_1539666 [Ramaria rubella]